MAETETAEDLNELERVFGLDIVEAELEAEVEEELDQERGLLGQLQRLLERLAEVRAGSAAVDEIEDLTNTTQCPRFVCEGRKV